MSSTTIPPTLDPKPAGRLLTDAENITRTDSSTIPQLAKDLREALLARLVSDDADDLVIALQVRNRLSHDDPSYWTSLADVARENGLDPADFELE